VSAEAANQSREAFLRGLEGYVGDLAAATVRSWGLEVQLDLLWLGDNWQVERIG